MTTSEALKISQDLDPTGIRTIGVLTKIDIMDPGTNAKKMLLGQEVSLRLGFVGVRNRSQQEINDKISVQQSLALEKKFFSTHPVYSSLPKSNTCTEQLSSKLTRVLFAHIKHNLPEIIKEIQDKIKDVEERLHDLGPSLPSTQSEKLQLVWNMITDFCSMFKNTISGRYDSKRPNREIAKEITGSKN